MLFLARLISYILNALLYFHLTDIEHCASSDFRCLYMDGCVPHSKVCDGIYDCLDTSDEMGCDISTKTPATTTAGDLPCSKHTVNHKLNNNSCNWIFVWDFISCSPLGYHFDRKNSISDKVEYHCNSHQFRNPKTYLFVNIFFDIKMQKFAYAEKVTVYSRRIKHIRFFNIRRFMCIKNLQTMC